MQLVTYEERQLVKLRKEVSGQKVMFALGRTTKDSMFALAFVEFWAILIGTLVCFTDNSKKQPGLGFMVWLLFVLPLPALALLVLGISWIHQAHVRKQRYATLYLGHNELDYTQYDFHRLYYERVGDKGSALDRRQLQLLCCHVTLEVLQLKAAGVDFRYHGTEEIDGWLKKEYKRATELADAIVKFDTRTKVALAAERERRQQAINDAAVAARKTRRDTALAEFKARRALEEPPAHHQGFDMVDVTIEGLHANNERLKELGSN